MREPTNFFETPNIIHRASSNFNKEDLMKHPIMYYASKMLLCTYMQTYMVKISQDPLADIQLSSGFNMYLVNSDFDDCLSEANITIALKQNTCKILEIKGCVSSINLPMSAQVKQVDILHELTPTDSVNIVNDIEDLLNSALMELNMRNTHNVYSFTFDSDSPFAIPVLTLRLNEQINEDSVPTSPASSKSLISRYKHLEHTNLYGTFFDNIVIDQPILAFSADMLMVSYLNALLDDTYVVRIGDYSFKQIYDTFNKSNFTTEVSRGDILFYKIVGESRIFGRSTFINVMDVTLEKTLTTEEQHELVCKIRRYIQDAVRQDVEYKNSKHLQEFKFTCEYNRIFGESQLKWTTK